MSALSVSPPFPIFTGLDGSPLEGGFIYIGSANQNPEAVPILVYWDFALTIPAAQPIRTLAGYPSRNGTPARLYVNADDLSISVKDSNGVLVYSALSSTLRLPMSVISGNLDASRIDNLDAGLVTYTATAGSAVATTVQDKLDGLLSLQDFGAVGDGVTDDTAAWTAWVAYDGGKVVLPGDYLVSAVVKTYEVPSFVNANSASTNHAAGFQALEKVQLATPEGDSNAAFGYRALANNTLGYRNVAFGREALFSQTGNLTTGNSNSAFGYQTLYNNTLGKDNVAIGYLSMFFNTEGGGNTAVGYRALYSNVGVADTTGQFNVAIGYESLLTNGQGNSNTALGWRSMFTNNTGTRNTAAGQESLRSNSIGTNNVAMGYHALHDNTSASQGVAIGYEALTDNVGGASNTAVGYRALGRNTSGSTNTAIGLQALEFTISGGSNLAGVNCTGLGSGTRISGDNQVQIGDSATTTYVYGTVQNRSDLRDKADVADTELGIDFIMGLRAVSGRWDMREDYHAIPPVEPKAPDKPEKPRPRIVDDSRPEHSIEPDAFELDAYQKNMDKYLEDLSAYKKAHSEWVQECAKVAEFNASFATGEGKDGSKKRKRLHQWFIAQEVAELCESLGVEFGGLQHHAKSGGDDVYSLGYDEFIPPTVKAVQQCWARLDELEARISAMEAKQ